MAGAAGARGGRGHRLVGGRRSAPRPARSATTGTAGGELDAFGWARAAAPPARSTRSTARCSCSRRGRCARCASTRRCALGTGSTRTSARQARAGGPQGRHRRPARIIHHDARAGRGPRRCGSRATSARPRSGRTLRAPADGRRLEGARPAGRGRARGRPGRRPRSPPGRDARLDALERRLRETTATIVWRITEPLRRVNACRRRARYAARLSASCASRRARGGSPPWRSPTGPARRRAGSAASTAALRDRERARLQQPPQHAPPCAPGAGGARSSRSRAWACGDVEDAVGLEPLEHRVAVPRVEERRDARPTTARRGATPRRSRRTPARRRAAGRRGPATKSSIAVSTPLREPPSCAAERGYGSPSARSPGSPGNSPPLPARPGAGRPPGSRRRRSSRRAGRAASDVVEQQQRQRVARRPLGRSAAAPRATV